MTAGSRRKGGSLTHSLSHSTQCCQLLAICHPRQRAAAATGCRTYTSKLMPKTCRSGLWAYVALWIDKYVSILACMYTRIIELFSSTEKSGSRYILFVYMYHYLWYSSKLRKRVSASNTGGWSTRRADFAGFDGETTSTHTAVAHLSTSNGTE